MARLNRFSPCSVDLVPGRCLLAHDCFHACSKRANIRCAAYFSGLDGVLPCSGVTMDQDGNLHGTNLGDSSGHSAVWELTP